MKAYLKNYRQSPRKVRLVTDLIKGKSADRAILILETVPKRATRQIKSLVMSALANAKQREGLAPADLFIQEIRVDKGLTMHRYMPKAHGRATRFDKHSSHVTLTLKNIKDQPKKGKAARAAKMGDKKTTTKKTKSGAPKK